MRLCEHERSVGKTVGEVPRKVFVIPGRNEPARKGLFAFPRSIGRDRSDGDGGGTALTYNATEGYFQYNWKTPKVAGPCLTVVVTTADGSRVTALFRLR